MPDSIIERMKKAIMDMYDTPLYGEDIRSIAQERYNKTPVLYMNKSQPGVAGMFHPAPIFGDAQYQYKIKDVGIPSDTKSYIEMFPEAGPNTLKHEIVHSILRDHINPNEAGKIVKIGADWLKAYMERQYGDKNIPYNRARELPAWILAPRPDYDEPEIRREQPEIINVFPKHVQEMLKRLTHAR